MTVSFHRPLRRFLQWALVPLLASCGGGPSGNATVTNLSVSGNVYSKTMTVTVNGAGLADTSIFMTVDGPCGPVTRGTASDFQVSFSCQVQGTGELSPRIRAANGDELGRVTVSVPTPQVAMLYSQGDLSGTVTIELDPAKAPATVLNFMNYVNSASTSFYTDTIIHRVIFGKLAQGGGYTTGPTPKAPTRSPIVLESNNGLKNLRGTIAMARAAGPDTATSQYFFNITDNPEFDYVDADHPGYAVFGRVLAGLDVLDHMGQTMTTPVDNTLLNVPVPEITLDAVLQLR